MREIQDFEWENISMSRPTLDLTPIGTNMTNGKTYQIDSISVKTKTPEPTPLKRPTEFPKISEKEHVTDDPDPDPSSSDSSPKKKKHDKKKKRRKHKKDDSSDPSSSEYYDEHYDSDYRCKLRKRKSNRKKDLIKLCAYFTKKLLMTAYKSKTIRFKINEDPLKRQIYFLTFVGSLEMIFSQYTENCEVLLDDPKIGGENIKEFAKMLLGIFCMQIFMYT